MTQVRKTIDDLLSFTEHPDVDKSLLPNECNAMLRILRDDVISRQNRRTYRQSTLHSFFRPQKPDKPQPHTTTTEPQPSTFAIKQKQPQHPEDSDEILREIMIMR